MTEDEKAKLQAVRVAVGTADWRLHEVLQLFELWARDTVIDDDEIVEIAQGSEDVAVRLEMLSDTAKSLALNVTERAVEARLQLSQALSALKALMENPT